MVKRILSFLRKRRRELLTLFGAFVIFATFVVKETQRDEMKETVGAIDRAQSGYKIRESFIRGMGKTQELTDVVEAQLLNPSGSKKAGTFIDEDPRTTSVRKLADFQDDNYLMLSNVISLFEELPERPARVRDDLEVLQRKFEKLQKDVEQYRTKVEKQLIQAVQKTPNLAGLPLDHADFAAMQDLLKRSVDLSKDIGKADSSVWKGAAFERTESEERYKRYSIYFYILFGLGWIVSLVAKLWLHHEGESESES